MALCQENHPKQVGDVCQKATDCLPTPALISEVGLTNLYLTCDMASQTCMKTDPFARK